MPGSGKKSPEFGTLCSEAQRRFVELVAPYAHRLLYPAVRPASTGSTACRPRRGSVRFLVKLAFG